MKRVQRAQRHQKPRPAVPPATSNRKPANRPAKPAAAAKVAAKVTTQVAVPPQTGTSATSAKRSARAAKTRPVVAPAAAQIAPAPPPPAAQVVSEPQVVNKPPRRGLGNLGRQSLHRQQATITLAVERPRALPLPDTTAQRSGAAVHASVKSSGAAALTGTSTAGLLQLRDGLRSLLGLLDTPVAAVSEAEKM